ncbi:MAG: exopolysaccharide biosynthesis polyprenyl glycosylphosphotransferase [Flavobacterium sp.]|jgi:exopolysaccharide biosynthesis polyprenyl glycosylphosphotransferase
MQNSKTTKNPSLKASSDFTTLLLLGCDMLGIVLLFNLNHWLITEDFSSNLLLTWKLVLILAFSFLYNYLMDLYTFDSPLSQPGMLERSFIANLLVGITIALTVYLLGPKFIGGFVGRGVLVSSLISLWFWSLAIRYLLNAWFIKERSQVYWLLIIDDKLERFLIDFRSVYKHEHLLILTKSTAHDFDLDEESEVVGSWQDLTEMMNTHPVSGIILTNVEAAPESLVNKLMQIRIAGTRIYHMNDFYEKYLSRLPVAYLNQQWLATALGFELIHSQIDLRFKRYVDVLIALVGSFLLSPLILAIALFILATSGGPILYRQVRTGEHNKNFVLNKFRTMYLDAEDGGIKRTIENDNRILPFGNILRKFRLDELPQFWNVLKGEMSFIGPRPERPEFIDELNKEIPYYNLRHTVKPGITGWAQVMTGYGDSTEDAFEKLQYDLYYIKNYSLILDISIMIKSIKVILFGSGR